MKEFNRQAQQIAQVASDREGDRFSAMTATPGGLRREINRAAQAGDGLRAAYLLGIEYARCTIACAVGNPQIYHEPTAQEVGCPKW